jgi:hypothetical protein
MDGARGALVPLAKGFRLRGSQARWGAVSCRGKAGEGTRRGARMEPHSGKGRHFWTASSHKTGPKWVCRELVDLSTMSDGSTLPLSYHLLTLVNKVAVGAARDN